MSSDNFTDFAEDLITDYFTGGGLSLPADFRVGLASAASDSSITELSGTGYARQLYTRSLANWAGTQGPTTTLASSGTSQATSNNVAINFGTSGSAWGTANYVVLYDNSGNALSYHALRSPQVIGSSASVVIPIGGISATVSLSGGATNYTVNKFIDLWFRGQAFSWPAIGYFALFTTAPSNAGGGVEVSGGAYVRQSINFDTTDLSATAGVISNNVSIAFPTPTAAWGTIGDEGVFDSLSGGNLLFWNPLDEPRTVLTGSSPQTHAVGSWSIAVT